MDRTGHAHPRILRRLSVIMERAAMRQSSPIIGGQKYTLPFRRGRRAAGGKRSVVRPVRAIVLSPRRLADTSATLTPLLPVWRAFRCRVRSSAPCQSLMVARQGSPVLEFKRGPLRSERHSIKIRHRWTNFSGAGQDETVPADPECEGILFHRIGVVFMIMARTAEISARVQRVGFACDVRAGVLAFADGQSEDGPPGGAGTSALVAHRHGPKAQKPLAIGRPFDTTGPVSLYQLHQTVTSGGATEAIG